MDPPQITLNILEKILKRLKNVFTLFLPPDIMKNLKFGSFWPERKNEGLNKKSIITVLP